MVLKNSLLGGLAVDVTISVDGLLHRTVGEQQVVGLLIVEAQLVDDHACAAVNKLLVGELHVYHAVALDTAELDHQGCRNHVESHLLGCARLHA